jgi:ubiquinone biosynthesis protein COQ4
MMQVSTNSQNPAPHLRQVLNLIDCISDTKGLSVPQIVDIEKLRILPTGTFGRTWAEFIDKHNLNPFTTGPRRKQLHDGVHILTGYGTDPIGELEVQAFLLGAKYSVFNLLLGLGLLRMVKKQMPNLQQFDWQGIQKAYQRGHNSNFDPDTWKPELLWHLPNSQVQAIFKISP